MTDVEWTNVDGTNVSKTVDNSYRWPLSSLDKIGLVSAEIFHYIQIRTNVAWTNVDVTNVNVTNVNVTNVPKIVDNSCRWPNHPTFKV